MTVTTKLEKTRKSEKTAKNEPPKYRYGPMPHFPSQRVWSRGILIFGILLYVWFTSKSGKEVSLAKQSDVLARRGQNFNCHPQYLSEIKQYPQCMPKTCGRFISDQIVTFSEAERLLSVAKKGIALGGGSGGATILDLHSGALSTGENFINAYSLNKKFVNGGDLAIYKLVRTKIQKAIAESFQIDFNGLFLTHPTFFSKMTNAEAKTVHDEYWHVHVDKETYESFHYTSLLYLSDFNKDFKGGRFIFVDNAGKPELSATNTTVEPRMGRVLMFTSGGENPHFVEKVTEGVRYAITVSFTCDRTKAISDPLGE